LLLRCSVSIVALKPSACSVPPAHGSCSNVANATAAEPVFAASGSDGKWARRYDEFTDDDFKDFSTSASGLQYKIIEEGFGVKPLSGQKIKAHYAGYLLNGAKFDASYDRGKPLEFQVGVGRVIKGWDEALLDMKVGEKRMLRIPSNLAYGSKGAGGVIPPDATLVFYVRPPQPPLPCSSNHSSSALLPSSAVR
jgi:FKBP-type peptidyl-prolyl cis-trans isomerase